MLDPANARLENRQTPAPWENKPSQRRTSSPLIRPTNNPFCQNKPSSLCSRCIRIRDQCGRNSPSLLPRRVLLFCFTLQRRVCGLSSTSTGGGGSGGHNRGCSSVCRCLWWRVHGHATNHSGSRARSCKAGHTAHFRGVVLIMSCHAASDAGC